MTESDVQATSQRLHWIDNARGLCMLMVLWFHAEMYSGIGQRFSICVTPFFMQAFFLSGYLFIRNKRQKVPFLNLYSQMPAKNLVFLHLLFINYASVQNAAALLDTRPWIVHSIDRACVMVRLCARPDADSHRGYLYSGVPRMRYS